MPFCLTAEDAALAVDCVLLGRIGNVAAATDQQANPRSFRPQNNSFSSVKWISASASLAADVFASLSDRKPRTSEECERRRLLRRVNKQIAIILRQLQAPAFIRDSEPIQGEGVQVSSCAPNPAAVCTKTTKGA